MSSNKKVFKKASAEVPVWEPHHLKIYRGKGYMVGRLLGVAYSSSEAISLENTWLNNFNL